MSTRGGVGGSDFMRVAGLAGIVSAIIFVVALIVTFAQGAPPALDSTSQEISKYFTDNEGLARVAGALNFLPILTLPILFVGWYSLVRDGSGTIDAAPTPRDNAGADGAWARVALIAFIALGAFSTIQGAAAFAIALGVKDEFGGQPAVGGALFDLYNAVGPASALTMALLLWAISNCRLAAGSPTWLKPALLTGAVAAAVSFLAPFLEVDALAFAGLLAFVIFIVWVGLTGMAFLKGADAGVRS